MSSRRRPMTTDSTPVTEFQPEPAQIETGATRLLLALGLWSTGLLLFGLMSGATLDQQVVLSSLTATSVGFGSLLLITRRRGVLLALGEGKLGPWATLSFALLFGLTSVTWVEPQRGLSAAIAQESVVRALVVLSMAQVVWTVAYLAGPGAGLSSWVGGGMQRLLDARAAGRTGSAAAWVLFGVAMFGQVLRIMTGTFGYLQDASVAVVSGTSYSQLVGLLAAMGDFALITAAYHHFRRDGHGSRFQVVVIATVLALVGLLAGTKQPAVLVAVDLLLAYGAARRRFPIRIVAIGTISFLLVVLPFVTAYRDVVRGNQNLSFSAAVQSAPEVALESTGTAQLSPSIELLRIRLREIDNVAMIVQKSPDVIAYKPLSEFAYAPAVGVVPRAIWVDKPIFATGYEFAREYFGQGSATYSSSAISPQGDLYRHGGLPIMLVGMLLVGIFMRLFDEVMRPELDFRALFFVIVVFPVAAKQEQDMVTFLLSLPGTLIIPIVGIWLTGMLGEGRTSKLRRSRSVL